MSQKSAGTIRQEVKRKNGLERLCKNFVVYVTVLSVITFGIPFDATRFLPDPIHQKIQQMFGIKDANAFQIKRVIRGVTPMAISGAETEVLTLSLVGSGADKINGVDIDLNKSFLLMEVTSADDRRTVTDVLGQIDGPDSLLFIRYSAAAAVLVNWTVVEFKAGVSVTSV